MKTTADPVRDYLAAVEREASALPADRRQELLADLAEHIEVTRAERPEAALGEVLAELGDPRTIAATALAEAGGAAPARRGKVHPAVPLLLLTVPFALLAALNHFVVGDFSGLEIIGVLARITGAVLLCTSVYWTVVQKVVGAVFTAVLPMVGAYVWNETTVAPAGELPTLWANLIAFTVILAATGWLWRVRRRA
ncbi:HAAS signaling domain-containing protein [Streptomyces sp. NPDC050504]|uniref:HAAS signaling domain-containing protein n=1 Tax=Streptomyces sp. NPDC050504 TaxID=3365618 RepID=UPI0037A49D36